MNDPQNIETLKEMAKEVYARQSPGGAVQGEPFFFAAYRPAGPMVDVTFAFAGAKSHAINVAAQLILEYGITPEEFDQVVIMNGVQQLADPKVKTTIMDEAK